MSMHFLFAKRVMLQIRAFLRTFLVDIMLCGRYLVDICQYLVNFVEVDIYYNSTGRCK